MYVLMDLEWIVDKNKRAIPTQIAAIRINAEYKVIGLFRKLIKPPDCTNVNWKDIALAKFPSQDFMSASSGISVFKDIRYWLRSDDLICWWHHESKSVFSRLFAAMNKQTCTIKQYVIREKVYAYLHGKTGGMKGSPYAFANALGIEYKDRQHDAYNDAETMRKLLASVHFPQIYLAKGMPQAVNAQPHLPYQGDIGRKIMHKRDCIDLPTDVPLKGFGSINKALEGEYQPCRKCLAEEFRKTLRAKNKELIDKSDFNYIYTAGSRIFHKYTCKTMLMARDLRGSVYYDTCARRKLRPCKICNPTPDDEPRDCGFVISPEGELKTHAHRMMPAGIVRAVKRHEQAQKDRYGQNREGLTKNETRDLMILSHPGYAFWSGKGYKTFHTRHCPKLQQVSDLEGYARYNDAIRIGLTPCKVCHPTKKSDVEYSIPITSRARTDDSVEYLRKMCDEHGFPHSETVYIFQLETPVGKWKIHMKTEPILLDHINLAKKNKQQDTYHRQPRAFLSLKDAMDYILRHDGSEDES